MFKFIRKKMNKKGFTLVELLVVIAVLGIIAGIAIPRMSGVTDSFKKKADIETARNLAREVKVKVEIGTYETGALIMTGADPTLANAVYFGEEFHPQTVPAGFYLIKVASDSVDVFTVADLAGTKEVDLKVTLSHGGEIK